MSATLLWLMRKAVYVAVGAALSAGAAYVSGVPDISGWTIGGAAAAVGSQVVRSLLTNLLPALYEALGGAQ